MEAELVKINCLNWKVNRGNNINESLVIKINHSADEIEKSNLDDIVSFQRSIQLLAVPDKSTYKLKGTEVIVLPVTPAPTTCELNFQILPKYIGRYITIVTDCQKTEIYENILKEYVSTMYGEFLDDFDGMQVYRYDIDISKSRLCTHLTIKLIPKVADIWIYGIQIILERNLQPCPAPIGIKLKNVNNILSSSSQKLSPSAERCRLYLQSYLENKGSAGGGSDYSCNRSTTPQIQDILSSMLSLNHHSSENGNIHNRNHTFPSEIPSTSQTQTEIDIGPEIKYNKTSNHIEERILTPSNIIDDLKGYFDMKILESERKIFNHMKEIEKKQNDKLDKILELLLNNQNNNNNNTSDGDIKTSI